MSPEFFVMYNRKKYEILSIATQSEGKYFIFKGKFNI